MNGWDDFFDTLCDSTRQLVANIENAWQELKNDLHDTFTVKYLRPGGVAYCKSEGKKYYGILTGTGIISLNGAREPDYMSLPEFLALHHADKLKVAAQKRIAVGCHEIDYTARLAVDDEIFPSTKVFALKCLAVNGAGTVDCAIEERFGSFEWLYYDIPEEGAAAKNDELE